MNDVAPRKIISASNKHSKNHEDSLDSLSFQNTQRPKDSGGRNNIPHEQPNSIYQYPNSNGASQYRSQNVGLQYFSN
jgi:hypothetical protein